MMRKAAAFLFSAGLVVGIYLAARWHAQRPPSPLAAAGAPRAFETIVPEFRYNGDFAGALQELSSRAHVRFEIEWESLSEVGFMRRSPVDLRLSRVTVAQVLEALQRQVSRRPLRCTQRSDGVIFIGRGRPPELDREALPVARLYDVSGMVAAGRQFWGKVDGGRVRTYLEFKQGKAGALGILVDEMDLPLAIVKSVPMQLINPWRSPVVEMHLYGDRLLVKASPDLQDHVAHAVAGWRELLEAEGPCTDP